MFVIAVFVIAVLVITGFVWLGRVRGPVIVSPFFVSLLAGTDVPRRTALRRTALASALTVIAVFLVPAAIVAVRLRSEPLLAGAVVLGAVVLGALCALAWLCGQARTFPRPRLLDRLDGEELLAQSLRWQAAGVLASTGDLAAAAGRFRALPRIGRRWRAVGTRPLFLLRGLVGAARTPLRLAAGVIGLALAGLAIGVAVTGLVTSGAHAAWWVLAVIGPVIGHLALGPLTDGFRHAAEAAASPPLYGVSTGGLYVRLAAVPLLVGVVAGAAGGWVGAALAGAGLAGAGLVPLASSAVLAATVMGVLVVVRAFDSAKGALPLHLLTANVPSPAGDPTALIMLGWQADALLIAAATGPIALTGLLLVVGTGGTAVLGGSAVAIIAVVGLGTAAAALALVLAAGLLAWATASRVRELSAG